MFVTSIVFVATFIMQSWTVMAGYYPSLQAYGVDTIAGYGTVLRSSKTFPNSQIVFVVTKPDGSKVRINAVTDLNGVAKIDLYDYHTRRAGTYGVSAMMKDDLIEGKQSFFTVFPDEVSLDKSIISVSNSVAKADGEDTVYVSVSVRDQYDNPFEGHQINLISSRATDVILSAGSKQSTDVNGTAMFKVSSSQAGVSVFSAVDTTAGTVLTSRAQVAFLNGDSLADVGGNLHGLIKSVAAADAGPLHHFNLGDFPVNIKPGDNISFRLTAKDSNNLTVENYTGTVHFSVDSDSDANVSLPEDYTFKADDLGTHLFSLGLRFTTAGKYKLVATDINNTNIKGEISLDVGNQGVTSVESQSMQNKPSIVMPAAGSYSDNVQTVSGVAGIGNTVKIYDNGQEIGAVQVDASGNYSFQTNPLSDGVHKIYSVALNQNGDVLGTSDTVDVSIDTKPPEVDDIILDPKTGIKPGTVLNVKVLTEENLSDAALIFNSDIVALTESNSEPGTYTAKLTAPESPGAYPVDVVLVDELNNEATYKDKAMVNVTAEGGDVVEPITQETQSSEQLTQQTQAASENSPPSEVFGLIAYGTDKKVTLVWEAANDDKNVNHYRIYYGLDPANLESKVDTKTAATTWYIPNLQNGKEYYFAVTAVDDEGVESVNKGQVVSAIPFSLEVSAAVADLPKAPLASNGDLHGASIESNFPPEMSKNGPETIWLIGFTALIAGIIRIGMGRKRHHLV